MEVKVLSEFGHAEALFGLGLSYGLTSHVDFDKFLASYVMLSEKNTENLEMLADNDGVSPVVRRLLHLAGSLGKKDGGHNKFLESISIWIDILAPRYWWQQIDSYRIGFSKQSESTERILPKRHLSQEDFERGIPEKILIHLNTLVDSKDLYLLKRVLPEAYLQKRIVSTNYKAIRNVVTQRSKDSLPEWNIFLHKVLSSLKHSEWIT